MSVRVKAPASSANLGPGFDVLGLSLALHNSIELDLDGQGIDLTVTGEGQGVVDRRPADNLAIKSIERFYKYIDEDLPPLRIVMDNQIPLTRGLGSSAATIVGALTAVNACSGANLSKEVLFDLAVEIEGHADNVAAALYGGLTIAYPQGELYKVRRCDPDDRVGVVVLIPDTVLSTAKARAALPEEVTRAAAVFNIGRVSLLIESLLTGDFSTLEIALEDALHQPWRRALIEDYDRVVSTCLDAGAKGVALSGAGPTMIAFYDRNEEETFSGALQTAVNSAGLCRRLGFFSVDPHGAFLA